MLIDIECPACYGLGRIHSPLKNGDPWDEGIVCKRCKGNGAVTEELEDYGDDE